MIKSHNEAIEYQEHMSKMINSLTDNIEKISENNLRWTVQTLGYTITMLRQEIDTRRGECKCKK